MQSRYPSPSHLRSTCLVPGILSTPQGPTVPAATSQAMGTETQCGAQPSRLPPLLFGRSLWGGEQGKWMLCVFRAAASLCCL